MIREDIPKDMQKCQSQETVTVAHGKSVFLPELAKRQEFVCERAVALFRWKKTGWPQPVSSTAGVQPYLYVQPAGYGASPQVRIWADNLDVISQQKLWREVEVWMELEDK